MPTLPAFSTRMRNSSAEVSAPIPPNSSAIAAFTKGDQGRVILDIRHRRQDATDMLVKGVAFLLAMRDAKADAAFIDDTAKGLHDALSNLVGGMRRDLDNAYLPPEDADIDMGELDAIIGRLP